MELIVLIILGIVVWSGISGWHSRSKNNQNNSAKPLSTSGYRTYNNGNVNDSARSNIGTCYPNQVELVQKAINESKNIEFMYRKPKETTFKRRVIKPTLIVNIDHEHYGGSTLCVKGFCYLRKAERTFAFKRMQQLKIQ